MDLVAITSNWPIDWIAIAAFTLLVALESFRAGTARGAALALSFPVTVYLFGLLQKAYGISGMLSTETIPYIHAIAFAVLLGLMFFCINRIVSSFDLGGGLPPAILCGLATAILVLVAWEQTPALHGLWQLREPLHTALAEQFRFYWTLAAVGMLTFART